ncbi:MAG: presqualene diphosphate synthase HpnD [Candidatus Latescibacteria bacterium]|nr:presqualene diphosphate synthase HpnD [Candidatus Latescibacterota bacterium]
MPESRRAASGTSFALAFQVLPPGQREAIRAVHAFSRCIDDSVDEEPDPGRARDKVARWRLEIAACYEGEPSEPAAVALRPHLARFRIPRGYLDELLSGVEMDLTHLRYATFEELRRYCYRVASVVGLICLRIFGDHEERGRGYAENLGLALQLTNILRDLEADRARGRIYIPGDEMRAFGYSEDALARGERTKAFDTLMRFQAARAREYFAQADREAGGLDRRRLLAAEIMSRIYQRLLGRIEASGFDVFRRRVRVPFLERAWITGSTLIASNGAR